MNDFREMHGDNRSGVVGLRVTPAHRQESPEDRARGVLAWLAMEAQREGSIMKGYGVLATTLSCILANTPFGSTFRVFRSSTAL